MKIGHVQSQHEYPDDQLTLFVHIKIASFSPSLSSDVSTITCTGVGQHYVCKQLEFSVSFADSSKLKFGSSTS